MNKPLTKTVCFLSIALLNICTVKAQLNEDFSDGDFTSNPAWVGGTSDFIINADGQLQSNNLVANSSFYLSTASTLAAETQWQFYSRLAFSTSGANYVDVYLVSASDNLLLPANTGYFVRLGNTDDEISLYRKDATGAPVKIIDGVNGTVGSSNNLLNIRVTRDVNNNWNLQRDATGGTNFVSEGTVSDATYLSAAFFGILVRQSTASFFQKHFFDKFIISKYEPDITPPAVASVTATSINTVDVLFSEPVDASTAQNIDNYAANLLGKPAVATLNAANPSLVTLSFSSNFVSSTSYTLTVTGVSDLAGNTLGSGTGQFSFFVIGRYSVVIDEIMADPTPQIGLPNAEWIELKNTTPVPINLQNYRLTKAGASSPTGPFPNFILQPDSFVVVTTSSQVAALSAFGRTISVTSFPSLTNEGDVIILQTSAGDAMHQVAYSSSWYQNNVKADGGWTLEMIDTRNPCAGASNWKASNDPTGGTPGKKNSVDAANADTKAPALLRAFAPGSNTVTLFFDEPLDETKAGVAASYTISDGIGAPVSAVPQGPDFSKVNLAFTTPLTAGKVYTVTISAITDCAGNVIAGSNTAKFGLTSEPDSLDLIVNELLYDPKPLGVDYLELYNRSTKIIDLSGISITNRSSTTGQLATPVKITADNYLLFPGEYIALTPDPAIIQQQFTVLNTDALLTMALPSFPDTEGTAAVMNSQGRVIDVLDYSYRWHSPLVDDEEGISLERIDFNQPTNLSTNWTSAAASAGFGTPGYKNSQFRSDIMPKGEITINPKLFSPDNDGFEDFTFITFQFPEPGYTANITIYDAAGRPVRVLQRNTTTAANGSFRWDGFDDKMQKVPVGTYIIYTDIFNLKGQKKQFKNTVVVARKF